MYVHRDVICTDPDHPQATLGATRPVQTVLRRAPTLDRACSRNSPPMVEEVMEIRMEEVVVDIEDIKSHKI